MRRHRLVFSAFVLATAASASGCGDGNDPEPTGNSGDAQQDVCATDTTAQRFGTNMAATHNGYSVILTSDPLVPTLGDYSTFTFTVTDPAGMAVPSGTKVSAQCLMSHAGGYSHGCYGVITVKELGDGVYSGHPVVFTMQGHWTFMLHITPLEGGVVQTVTYDLCLE